MGKFYLVIAAIMFMGFVYFSYLVSQEIFIQFDFDTTVRLQNHISRQWDIPFSLLSLIGTAEITLGIWFVLLLFIAMRGWWKVLVAFTLLPISQGLELFGKIFLLHPGPPFLFFRGTLPFHFPSNYIHTDYSYPSGHTIRIAFLIVFALFWLERRGRQPFTIFFQGILTIFLLFMFISRIYLGEHWVTDVIGGALLGISLGILAGVAIPKSSNEGHNHPVRKLAQ